METGKTYWRSLDELHESPEFDRWLHREFQEGASELPPGTSRRDWVKLMAASVGLAGATACRKPVENIMPHARGVEDYIPGKPYFYSTAMAIGGQGSGLMVEVNDGRPTKVEGNPAHPFSLGAANGYAQASILSLYDPDRQRQVLHDGADSTWEAFFQAAPQELNGGNGVRFLSERIASPSYAAVRDAALKKFPAAKWVEYEPVSPDNGAAGAQMAFGQAVTPVYQLDKADVVLAIDSDFLGCDAQTPLTAKQFARKRRVATSADEMNRLYAIESMFTVTGAMADHRLRAKSSDIRALASQLGKQLGVSGLNVVSGSAAAQDKFLTAVAKDLQNNKGKSLVVVGPRQPAEVHALVYAINQALGNVGQTVSYVNTATAGTAFRPQMEGLKELVTELNGGSVQALVILCGNPVFTAPADLNFGEAMKKAKSRIYLTHEPSETSALASWVLPEAHFMETWGDVMAPDGTATIQQPMIQPLFNGKSAAEVVANITGYPDQRAYDIVRNFWMAKLGKGADADKSWRKAVHDGVIPNTAVVAASVTPDAGKVNGAFSNNPPAASGIEVVFVPSSHTYDGRYANNAWLQEAPDPMTKLVWDNAALMSPATAKKLGVQKSDMISIEHGGRKVEVPVMEQPGHADDSITLAVGHGRTICGRIGKNAGTNVYPLRTSDGFGFITGVNVTKTGRMIDPPLATTQEHHSMEGRDIIREATLETYKNPKEFEEHFGEKEELFSLFQEHDFSKGYQWGMAIDLNTCIGCNACIIACQAENNIPVVGKEQVLKGREMHWIRLDRYYSKNEDDPQALMQVMLCQQCQNAPCEAVCPVAATAHSPEGLNDMAYNRCVGTRYCSNNCPYKVRRFNFFNWHEQEQEIQKMSYNPDVTVRMRGVMEKCNYCVQRIQEAKITAKAEGRRPVRDGEIQTACQQTCPTESIVFGNINDPNSRVTQLKKQNRDYAVLADLNVKPRTTYLAKLRNPNPELA